MRGLGVPDYLIESEGPDHMKTFTAQVRVGDRLYGHGIGRSKKEAEQLAAETAYGEIFADVSDPAAAAMADEVNKEMFAAHADDQDSAD